MLNEVRNTLVIDIQYTVLHQIELLRFVRLHENSLNILWFDDEVVEQREVMWHEVEVEVELCAVEY